jgi:hypothetical protein
MALLVAGTVYIHGFWSGKFLTFRALSESCSSKPLGDPSVSWTWLPLRHICHWEDGTTSDLVPAYVNPALVIAMVTAVVCMVMAVRAHRRKR